MALAAVTLDDKYVVEQGRVFLTGTQALVRLPMLQKRRDEKAGLNTAGFISGYRGSPLGGFDQGIVAARRFIAKHNIQFWPGVNEDLAATAVWGTQQVNLFPGAKVDGVFSMWYGKAPGVDRTGDAFRHANAAGSAKHGGVLVLAGDDHAPKSSTLSVQSEHSLVGVKIPVLYPAGVQDFLDYGLYGWAMSRYTGLWIGFKVVSDTVESAASVMIDPHRAQVTLPTDFAMPEGGLNIRWPDLWYVQDDRIELHKLNAARAFVRANKMDRVVIDGPKARLGIVSVGKSYLDVRQALDDLGIDETMAADIGIRLYKVAMSWPLEPEGLKKFAEGLEEIMVVEEKRALLEPQIKEILYHMPEGARPRVLGKSDETGAAFLSPCRELQPSDVARAIAKRLKRFYDNSRIEERLGFLDAKDKALAALNPPLERTPYFCSGCPHNTSTRVPEGSRALSGIGCHFMAQWMDRRTDTYTHMGAEGTNWIGQAPFTETQHIFQNIGDGTYFHSGILAVRACVAANVNMTFKILYNDAVAMTGGQHVDGQLSVPQVTRQLASEGVKRIAVVSDDPEKYAIGEEFAPGVTRHHRDDLDAVQRELREWKGVSALVYDQTCAAEKRRRRKRGTFPDPQKRIFINELVCEGCGDCSVKSNCLSVVPVETEFGRKRAIDQSSCNKDYSCAKGFCPSFVTVLGGQLKKRKTAEKGGVENFVFPEPERPATKEPYNILVAGVGGTGVVTIGALLGMASHIEGKGCTVLDITGLAQKGGAVLSHVRLADDPEQIHAVRVAAGEAHLILGCDLVVAAGKETLAKMRAGFTRAVVNDHETPTAGFTRNPDLAFPTGELEKIIGTATGAGRSEFLDATELATHLLGDSIASNLFMLGYAYQKGLIPVSSEALLKAIELNAVSVDMNRRAFLWGRRAALDLPAVERAATPATGVPTDRKISKSLDEIVARRVTELTAYQNAAYAKRYADLVERVKKTEAEKAKGMTGLALAVARYAYKLMAYKDEYEVARLYGDADFARELKDTFEGDYKLHINLAPPLLASRDPVTGELQKQEYGTWVLGAFRILAKLKGLRGTPFDIFGYSHERRTERKLIGEYEATVDELLRGLTHDNHALAVEIASMPEQIRGYGHIKERHLKAAKAREAELLAMFRNPSAHASAAE
ncbi:MAG: indolepyruvate ferredoxin oxidoreductase family protein [Alphaproteobacteria bacterium]